MTPRKQASGLWRPLSFSIFLSSSMFILIWNPNWNQRYASGFNSFFSSLSCFLVTTCETKGNALTATLLMLPYLVSLLLTRLWSSLWRISECLIMLLSNRTFLKMADSHPSEYIASLEPFLYAFWLFSQLMSVWANCKWSWRTLFQIGCCLGYNYVCLWLLWSQQV